jgi:8-oxo-dGTP pyrophosphatase MutT (NUDIX family)
MQDVLRQRVITAQGTADDKKRFFSRILLGDLTRPENKFSHFCVYFAAVDPARKQVFIGHHKKSGLWLFNGGHMEPGELPEDAVVREAKEEWGFALVIKDLPQIALVTVTTIEHPEKQICREHYDLWYFLPYSVSGFRPDNRALGTEFFTYGWKSYEEADTILTSSPTKTAMRYLKNVR